MSQSGRFTPEWVATFTGISNELLLNDALHKETKNIDNSEEIMERNKVSKHVNKEDELLKPFRSNLSLYNQLKKALELNIIYINKEKLNFPFSQKTITSIFKTHKYNKWKFLERNILTNHNIPSKLGNTRITKTKEFLEFQSKTKY